MLKHVYALAETIGPRGTGTAGEAAAADYVDEQLTGLGLPVERQTFRAVASQNAFPLAVDLLALLAVIVYPLGGAPTRWIAALLALSCAPLLLLTIRNASSWLRVFLPQVESQSVITTIEPQAAPRQQVVLLAHLDTNRARLAWQSAASHTIEPLTWLTLGMLAAPGLLYLAGALLDGPVWAWRLSLLPAAYVLGTLVTLWIDDRTPFTCGANDNAASVAVALEIVARLVSQPLSGARVWLAFTGAEETDHSGLRRLLRIHGEQLRQAYFIDLEGVGGGEIVYLTRQGVALHYRPDPGLLALAEQAALRHPELGVRPAEMLMTDEVSTLRGAGYRAICIAGRDPETGTLPHWHRRDDTAETVSPQTLERAADFVWAFLEQIDTAM